jgi:hypothetical protein
VGAELVYANRQGEDTRCFRNFINAPKNRFLNLCILDLTAQ